MLLKENVKRVNGQLYYAKVVHEGVRSMKHGIRQDGEWIDYYPTYFIYSFFAFNSLYNYDWETSLRIGELKEYDEQMGERYKQKSYIDFVFSDPLFTSVYKDQFTRDFTRYFSKETIIQELESMSDDRFHRRMMISSVNSLFKRDRFNKDIVDEITKYLYRVRNNIFHGAKSVKEMEDLGQQRRLIIYASFVIALNQMVFSYIAYLNKSLESMH